MSMAGGVRGGNREEPSYSIRLQTAFSVSGEQWEALAQEYLLSAWHQGPTAKWAK
jgi:hypothetical protein